MLTAFIIGVGAPSAITVIADERGSAPRGWRVPRLAVMPLGDSITFGTGSSTGSGYRAELRNRLTSHSTDVSIP